MSGVFYNCEICGAQNNIKLNEQKKAEIALEVVNKIKVETDYQYRFIVQQAMEDLFRQLKEKPKRPRCPSCGYGIHNYYDFQTKAECKPCGKMLEELMEALDIKPQK